MDETVQDPAPAAPQLVARSRLRVPLVWMAPILAAMVALSIYFERAAREGPEVVITFKSAQGLEPGKTPVRYKDVQIGVVTAVELSEDFRLAQVTARINRKAAPLMSEGASFWIVRPRVGLTEVSGLGTLFSGNYIAFEHGGAHRPQRRFSGLDNAMVVAADTPGRKFVLRSRDALRIDVGLPVYHVGLQVGQVTACDLASDGEGVEVQVFVNAPYDAQVRGSTRFWNASGLDVGVRGGDVTLRTESILALLVGGIAFESSPALSVEAARRAPERATFTLFRDRDSALAPDDSASARYVLQFDEPVDGLRPGALVTVLGVPAGQVKDVRVALDPRSGRARGRVEITFRPEHALGDAGAGFAPAPASRALVRRMVGERGLRAQLRAASLVTGRRYVAFDYFPDAPAERVDWAAAAPVLPSVRGTLPAFEAKVQRLLDKLDALPMDEALADARSAMREAAEAMATLRTLAADVDGQAVPAFVATMNDARHSLEAAERMMDNASATLVGPDAPGQRELRTALAEIGRAARSVRTLADAIERQPQSLIWGRRDRPQPTGDAPTQAALP